MSTTDPLSPALQKAALRAGLRTFYQTAGATAPTMLAVGQIATWGDIGQQALSAGVAVGVALVSGVLAGFAAYLSFAGNGVPDDYRNAV